MNTCAPHFPSHSQTQGALPDSGLNIRKHLEDACALTEEIGVDSNLSNMLVDTSDDLFTVRCRHIVREHCQEIDFTLLILDEAIEFGPVLLDCQVFGGDSHGHLQKSAITPKSE